MQCFFLKSCYLKHWKRCILQTKSRKEKDQNKYSVHTAKMKSEINRIYTSILLLLILLVSGCDFFERKDNKYKDYSEAIESQSWKGGWLPELLPKDAINIFESHYIDRPSVIVSFEFTGDFKAVLDNKCTKTPHIKFADMNASWWPNNLTGEAFGSSHEYHYYKCFDKGVCYFAIPFDQQKAYFWRRSEDFEMKKKGTQGIGNKTPGDTRYAHLSTRKCATKLHKR